MNSYRLLATTADRSLVKGTAGYPEIWWGNFSDASGVLLATGYVAVSAISLLRSKLQETPRTKLRLLVGMAITDGLTKSQKNALLELDDYLTSGGRGGVFVTRTPFHGKFSIFEGSSGVKSAILGSSNMSGINPLTGGVPRNTEVDIEVTDSTNLEKLVEVSKQLMTDSTCWPLVEAFPHIRTVSGPLESLVGQPFVEEVGTNEYLNLINNYEPGKPFSIPLSTHDSSSLNAYFGAPRKQKNGKTSPRDWYEVSLVVPSSARIESIDYPVMMEFFVVTDDGYTFVGKTSGQSNKNFSSRKNNRLIGRWLKGRLEDAGLLSRGQRITDDMLRAYGATSLTMRKTKALRHDHLTGKSLPVYVMSFAPTVK